MMLKWLGVVILGFSLSACRMQALDGLSGLSTEASNLSQATSNPIFPEPTSIPPTSVPPIGEPTGIPPTCAPIEREPTSVPPTLTSTPTPTVIPSQQQLEDLSQLAGMVYLNDRSPQGPEVWSISEAGVPKFLAVLSPGSYSVDVYPDGSKIVYEKHDWRPDIWVMDLITGTNENITSSPDRSETGPHWWPGHTGTIIFTMTEEPYGYIGGYPALVDQAGGEYQVLDDEIWIWNDTFSMEPNGNRMTYENRLLILGQKPNFLGPVGLGLPETTRFKASSWSPVADVLAYHAFLYDDEEKGSHIALLTVDLETGLSKILHSYTSFIEYEPVYFIEWSPDGEWIAFNSLKGPLWIVRADGSDSFSPGEGIYPVWSADGRWLLFNPDSTMHAGVVGVEMATREVYQILPDGVQAIDWISDN